MFGWYASSEFLFHFDFFGDNLSFVHHLARDTGCSRLSGSVKQIKLFTKEKVPREINPNVKSNDPAQHANGKYMMDRRSTEAPPVITVVDTLGNDITSKHSRAMKFIYEDSSDQITISTVPET